MIDAIKKRRAIREFLAEPIPEAIMNDILLSAMYAPSANALHPWELIVVENPETRDRLSKVTPWATSAKTAAAVIVIVAHESESPQWVEDAAIVAEHIWLSATDHGLGGCWIHARKNRNAESEIRAILGIPVEHRVSCMIALGTPVKAEPEHDEEAFDESKVKYERY
jgi:nitroreductase